jgi:single-stranded-DNA-specific exonuclease
MQWILPPAHPERIALLARKLGISPVLANLLLRRGYDAPDAALAFLNPNLADLADPLLMGGMRGAVNRLEQALRKQESVLIFGDYDVDGVTSTSLLAHFLRQFGLNPRFIVPRRMGEGYGLSVESLERAIALQKPDLVIAVDCGTSGVQEVRWLKDRGISVIIIDHHSPPDELPADCELVNPHVLDPEDVPWKDLCSVGLVFKFCHAVVKVLRQKGDPLAAKMDLRQYLDLVALGTVADLVRLTGENRILVRSGLKALQACRRPGICALMDVAGLSLGDPLDAGDIGFKLGPRINASGRLDDATLPIELLLSEDWQSCREKAQILDQHNGERQEIERHITLEAEKLVDAHHHQDLGLVLYAPHWHTGVVGIVASRLTRQFHRPALVLGAEEGFCKGSGRSIPGVNLVELLGECASLLDRWGGHPMAVGVSLAQERIDAFREAFNGSIATKFPQGLPERQLEIDAILKPADLSPALLEELESLAPYGQGMSEPVFALPQVNILHPQRLRNGHFKCFVESGRSRIEVVAWNIKETPDHRSPVNIAAKFHWHSWRGERQPRLTLVDWKQPALPIC